MPGLSAWHVEQRHRQRQLHCVEEMRRRRVRSDPSELFCARAVIVRLLGKPAALPSQRDLAVAELLRVLVSRGICARFGLHGCDPERRVGIRHPAPSRASAGRRRRRGCVVLPGSVA